MIRLRNIRLGYGDTAVLSLSGLDIAPGEHWLLTGPSGSGKTSLLYAIAGLLPVRQGSIHIGETDITTLPESTRDRFRGRHIGVVFQTLHLMRSLSVMGNLLLPAYASGSPSDESAARAALERVGLSTKARAWPHELSQGQAQRVAIARATLGRPLVLLADEPTSSLDDASCRAVIQLLQDAARQCGASLLVATHDARVASTFPATNRLELAA